MIEVIGHDLWRGGAKIGYIREKNIFDHSGEKAGFYTDSFVFDNNGHKQAYIEGDSIHFLTTGDKIRIEDNNKDVVGGDLTNIQKAAVRILLGE